MNCRCRSFRLSVFAGVLAGLILQPAGAARLVAEQTPAPSAMVEGAPEIKQAVYGFFDDHTGLRTGVLRIGRVGLEYRRQGFMRVAWRPLVVLMTVDLDVSENMSWPAEGTQIAHTLLSLGGKNELVLRDVRLHLAGSTRCEVNAATARLLSGGILELLGATASGAGGTPSAQAAGTFRLRLTGPQAGQLTRMNLSTGLHDLEKLAVNTPPPAPHQ